MKKTLIALLLALCAAVSAAAQCASRNTAFQSGEDLTYDLYFNWKFVWVKAGTAAMKTVKTSWRGKDVYRTYLITKGSPRADKFFVMRDTLTAYYGLDLVPHYFLKGAFEGKTYRRNEVTYSYPAADRCTVKMRYRKNAGTPDNKTQTSTHCAFDMISMLMRARSFDPSNYKNGHRIKFLMADGRHCEWQAIVYHGKKTIKMRGNGESYRCLVFSFMETEKGKESEVVRFFVTDDDNHLPVRLDLNLNFGVAKAYLSQAKGLRHALTAKVSQ